MRWQNPAVGDDTAFARSPVCECQTARKSGVAAALCHRTPKRWRDNGLSVAVQVALAYVMRIGQSPQQESHAFEMAECRLDK
jgi:hypothetical protein